MNALIPSSLAESMEMAEANPTYRLIAGGSDWMVEKGGEGIILLRGIDELRRIEMRDEGMFVGAAATVSEIAVSPLIGEYYPMLESACGEFGSRQIRNVATIGGNVAHASPAADLVPALLVLGAKTVIQSRGVRRFADIDRLILYKGKTDLKNGEIITGFMLPNESWSHWYYHKIGRRSALNIAIASLCALGRKNNFGGWEVRLSGASLSASPRRFGSVETLFVHGVPDAETIREALAYDIDPHSGLRGSREYRYRVTENMIVEFSHALA